MPDTKQIDRDDEDSLEIKLSRLEKASAGQAQKMFVWGKELAGLSTRLKREERILKLLAAQLLLAIKSDPLAYGLDKVTEESAKAAVIVNPKYQKQQNILEEIESEYETVKAYVSALHERGEQIGNLTKLHGQMYWSKPSDKESKQRSREKTMRDASPK